MQTTYTRGVPDRDGSLNLYAAADGRIVGYVTWAGGRTWVARRLTVDGRAVRVGESAARGEAVSALAAADARHA